MLEFVFGFPTLEYEAIDQAVQSRYRYQTYLQCLVCIDALFIHSFYMHQYDPNNELLDPGEYRTFSEAFLGFIKLLQELVANTSLHAEDLGSNILAGDRHKV